MSFQSQKLVGVRLLIEIILDAFFINAYHNEIIIYACTSDILCISGITDTIQTLQSPSVNRGMDPSSPLPHDLTCFGAAHPRMAPQ
jgi:hypothetical protein